MWSLLSASQPAESWATRGGSNVWLTGAYVAIWLWQTPIVREAVAFKVVDVKVNVKVEVELDSAAARACCAASRLPELPHHDARISR